MNNKFSIGELTSLIFEEFFEYKPSFLENIKPNYIELKKNNFVLTEVIPFLILIYEDDIYQKIRIYVNFNKDERILILVKDERHIIIKIKLLMLPNKQAEICYLSNDYEINSFYKLSFDRIYTYLKYHLY